MKILISKKTDIIYYYKGSGDYHCKEGFLKEEDINSGSKIIYTNTGREFLVFEANHYDYYNKIKRGPQILIPKDIGYIIARSGIDKNSFVIEAGGGSGGITSYFSRICRKVHTYEIKPEHCDIIKKNIEFLELENVELFNQDLSENIENEKDIDLLFLDMPDPKVVLEKDLSGIKSGNYIVCYLPSIVQIADLQQFVFTRDDLYWEEMTEIITRQWKITKHISRPFHNKETDHTAFLAFIRKV